MRPPVRAYFTEDYCNIEAGSSNQVIINHSTTDTLPTELNYMKFPQMLSLCWNIKYCGSQLQESWVIYDEWPMQVFVGSKWEYLVLNCDCCVDVSGSGFLWSNNPRSNLFNFQEDCYQMGPRGKSVVLDNVLHQDRSMFT